MLIDYTYFQGELNIPRLGDENSAGNDLATRQKLQTLIDKYEPKLLSGILGYAFYKAFIAGVQTTPPVLPNQRWQDLIYGAEYTDAYGSLNKWRGLLDTTVPVYSFGSGYIYKAPEWVTFDSETQTQTFLGWAGWVPIIIEPGSNGPLQADVDYTFDATTGLLTRTGSMFHVGERFFVQFQLRPQNVNAITSGLKQSLIANYVYFYYMRDKISFNSPIGNIKTKPVADGETVGVQYKQTRAWNEMSEWAEQLYSFLDSSLDIYPEYDSQIKYCNEFAQRVNVLNI